MNKLERGSPAQLPAPMPMPMPAGAITWTRTIAIALREFRAGLGGFYVFIACIALGVAVITTVGALSDALRKGFEVQGQSLLGGDVALSRMHRRADAAERSWLDAQGLVSETGTVRAMARRPDGKEQALIEIKAVDQLYPLVDRVATVDGSEFKAAVSPPLGVAVEPALLERLSLKIGDTMRIGDADLVIRAAIGEEPDGIADRLTYGPRVFMSLASLEKTGLVQPGTLVRWRYALLFDTARGAGNQAFDAFREDAKRAMPESGFTIADRRDPSPRVSKTLDRLRQFLTFLGLTSLLVGGVGVASSVATFIERRARVIATMKSLGAPSRLVFTIFLVQVLAIALVGVAIGLVIGMLAPVAINALYGDLLPVKAEITYSLQSLVTGATFGLLVALLFTLWPLGRAEMIRPSMLFRDEVAPETVWPPRRVLVLIGLVAVGLFAFTVLMAESQRIALYFCGGLVVMLGIFAAMGVGVTAAARRAPRASRPEVRLAIANIGAPGGLARSVVLSLGAGLTLLVAVALTDSSLRSELESRLPRLAPTYFVLDIPKSDFEPMSALIKREAPNAVVVSAPLLRGRLVALKGQAVETLSVPPEAQWVLNGDRGLTFSEAVPEGSRLVKGEWWSSDYGGEPLVSFESELARQLGVGIGDEVTVNVLGRNLTARIANLREVTWENLSLNFVMVFSPNALKAAPFTLLATINLPASTGLDQEAEVARRIGNSYPMVSVIRVKDAIDVFSGIFVKVMTAVRAAGSITLISGALVLAGALATAQRRRIMEAVVLKVLGATRRRILLAHLVEYGLLAAVVAMVAVGLGSLAAWFTVAQIMRIPFDFSVWAVAQALMIAFALVAAFGLVGTSAVLKARPVPYLRTE